MVGTRWYKRSNTPVDVKPSTILAFGEDHSHRANPQHKLQANFFCICITLLS
jgi:hypothetical protein